MGKNHEYGKRNSFMADYSPAKIFSLKIVGKRGESMWGGKVKKGMMR